MIAPLLFIPLIENAFKHGVSSTQESFINIKFELQGNNRINCLVENSNYPKKDNDRSGSGIGLTNLKRRLELLYPGKYIFKAETLNNDLSRNCLFNFKMKGHDSELPHRG